jgi:hypothetical protein
MQPSYRAAPLPSARDRRGFFRWLSCAIVGALLLVLLAPGCGRSSLEPEVLDQGTNTACGPVADIVRRHLGSKCVDSARWWLVDWRGAARRREDDAQEAAAQARGRSQKLGASARERGGETWEQRTHDRSHRNIWPNEKHSNFMLFIRYDIN